ncbi:hypothetical protein A4R28_13520 [Mesorhizobium ciceri]|nr:hypothetical protein A4R28_13520 [Mesorhizobium ciceri]
MVRTPQCRRFAGQDVWVGSKLQLNSLARGLVPGPVIWFQASFESGCGKAGERAEGGEGGEGA